MSETKFVKSVKWVTPTTSYFAQRPREEGEPEGKEEKAPSTPPIEEELRCSVKEGLNIDVGFIYMVCGQTGSGKSNLVKDIVQANYAKFDVVMLMCPDWDAPKRAPAYAWLHSRFKRSPKSDAELIAEIDAIDAWTKKHPGKEALVVLDDCQGLCDVKGKAWSRIAVMTRHSGLTVLVCFQALQKTDTIFRDQAQGLFLTDTSGSSIPIIATLTNKSKSEIIRLQEIALKNHKFNCLRIALRGGREAKIFLPPPAANFFLRCRW